MNKVAGLVQATSDPSSGQGVPEAAIRAALAKVLASRQFVASERNRAFLRFIVDETLACRSDRIKGYTIAVEVFGRNASFDPQGDPVVRIEAGRLRRALELYYLSDGLADEVVIEIAKGSYVPSFTMRETMADPLPADEPEHAVAEEEQAAVDRPQPALGDRLKRPGMIAAIVLAALLLVGAGYALREQAGQAGLAETMPKRPSIIVLPFADPTEDNQDSILARGFADEVITQLTHFKEIVVYGRGTGDVLARSGSLSQAEQDWSVGYLLEGSIRAATGHMRVSVRLLDARNNEIIWAETFERQMDTDHLFVLQEEIAGEVATRIAQPYGIVAQASDRQTSSSRPDDMSAYRCGLRFYAYRASPSPEIFAEVRACLEDTTTHYSRYATGWAMLAYMHIDQDRFWSNGMPQDPPPLDLALDAATRAVALDPNDVRAVQALMMTHFLRKEVAQGLAAGERGLALNPNDTEFLGEFGVRLALLGQWERGTGMVREALARDPANAPIYRTVLALDAFDKDNYQQALAELDRVGLVKVPLFYGIRAAILGQLGRTAEAAEDGNRFFAGMPGFFERFEAELAKRNMQPEFRQKIVDGLRKAGLPVPDKISQVPSADTTRE